MGIVVEPKMEKGTRNKNNVYQHKKSGFAQNGEWYLPRFSTPASLNMRQVMHIYQINPYK